MKIKSFELLAQSMELICSKLLAKEDWEIHSACEAVKAEMLKTHTLLLGYEEALKNLMDKINGEV